MRLQRVGGLAGPGAHRVSGTEPDAVVCARKTAGGSTGILSGSATVRRHVAPATNAGDACVISLTSGGEMRIPTKAVLTECASYEDAYQQLCQSITNQMSARPHIELGAGVCA